MKICETEFMVCKAPLALKLKKNRLFFCMIDKPNFHFENPIIFNKLNVTRQH